MYKILTDFGGDNCQMMVIHVIQMVDATLALSVARVRDIHLMVSAIDIAATCQHTSAQKRAIVEKVIYAVTDTALKVKRTAFIKTSRIQGTSRVTMLFTNGITEQSTRDLDLVSTLI